MTNKQTHREPTLYIVGNIERKDEIKHIIEDEWGGDNIGEYEYNDYNSAYYISSFGMVNNAFLKDDLFKIAVANGWMKEYKLPEKPQFKPFDKVVVKTDGSSTWFPALFGYRDENEYWLQGDGWVDIDKSIILPYNEQTAKLIGTHDEWKGDDNE